MKVLEVFDEFENLKPESAAAKYKYAERKVEALKHQLQVIEQYLKQFRGKYTGLATLPVTTEDALHGDVHFESRRENGKTRFVVYNKLTPQELALLTSTYKKYCFVTDTYFKLNKNLATLKRNAAKEAGTYISKQDATNYEQAFQKDMAKIVATEVHPQGYKTYIGGTRTKKNGTSRVYVRIESKHPFTANATFFKFIENVKEKILQWMVEMNFDLRRIVFNKGRNPGTGEFVAKIKTKDLVEKYKNK